MKRLAPGQHLTVRNAVGCTLQCCVGTVWITQENDERDIFLATGERFTFDRPGLALISAVGGKMHEGASVSQVAVISLPRRVIGGVSSEAA